MRWPRRRRRRPEPSPVDPSTLWALDLEITGLDVEADHIVEIGIVPIVDRRILLGRAWSTLVQPESYRPAGTVVHQIMPGDLDAAVEPREAVEALWALVQDQPLLVHHAALDLPFLRRLHHQVGLDWPNPTVVDTVELLLQRNRRLRQLGQPELPLQLGQARQALGLPAGAEHRALADAAATAELWLALTGAEAAGIAR